jgi:pheromone shutdown protein TraB
LTAIDTYVGAKELLIYNMQVWICHEGPISAAAVFVAGAPLAVSRSAARKKVEAVQPVLALGT